MKIKTSIIGMILTGALLFSTSCIIVHPSNRSAPKSSKVFKKGTKNEGHPHGKPPGQRKKRKGHPGKVH